jgi:hypothetical protein
MEIIKTQEDGKLSDIDVGHNWKILRYILRSKNPRLYV